MRITKEEVYESELASQVLAQKDIEIYLRILSGAEVPPGVDLESLMDRVDLWERQQIFELADRRRDTYWWVGLLACCIYDSWRRKVSEALRSGRGLRAITTTGQSILAFGATVLLVTRQIFFPLAPIGLQPLRYVVQITAA